MKTAELKTALRLSLLAEAPVVLDQVRALAALQFKVHPEALREDTVVAALGDNWHPRIELLIALEQHFDIRLLDHSIADCVTLGEIAEAIEKRRQVPLQAAE